jgi:1-acyl-sn-glycerol-3-phosphate acyltransferase
VQNTVQEPVETHATPPAHRPATELATELATEPAAGLAAVSDDPLALAAAAGHPAAAHQLPSSESAIAKRERSLCNGINPWLAPLAMVLTQDVALRGFFRGGVTVLGQEHLSLAGPLLLAPTHRSRWDALMLPRAAGRRVTGRDCRFMVSSDEMVGLQGWFLHRLGCFPVNPRKPAAASLRFAVDLLAAGQQLVVFPEGRIQQDDAPLRLMPGLARLAALAEGMGVPVPVQPVGLAYSHARPRFGDRAALCFGPPLRLGGGGRAAAAALNAELQAGLEQVERLARQAVGRPLQRT